MHERTCWHPVASLEALSEAPLAVTLLDEPLVLWKDNHGTVRAFADRCPHRGARLSLGCVRAGVLECPYHGWQFDGAGQVVHVPALPAFQPPATHRAASHDVQLRHGLVWVRLHADAGDAAPLPAFAAEDDTRLRKTLCGPYEVATSAPRIVENFLDMSHFGFVHEGWLGAREHAAFHDHAVQATPTGFLATGCRAWQPQSSVHAQGGADVEYTYEVNAPYTAVLTKVPDGATGADRRLPRSDRAVHLPGDARAQPRLVPHGDERFHLARQQACRPSRTPSSRQDQPVLESQQPRRLPLSDTAPVRELHSAADRSSAAYRRYLRERGITFGTC